VLNDTGSVLEVMEGKEGKKLHKRKKTKLYSQGLR
jgi:hypothetical protein